MVRRCLLWSLLLVLLVFGGLVVFMYAAPDNFLQQWLKAARSYAGLEKKEIVLADGQRFAYLEGGKGEPLLLLHGFGGNKDNFDAIAPRLTQRYRLIIPDLIGFGESSKPLPADYGPEAQAARLREFLLALGITGKVHVGGNSMGGMISLHFGKRFPEHTASLWLLNPAGVFSAPVTPFMKTAFGQSSNPLQANNAEELGFLLSKMTAKPIAMPQPLLEVLAREHVANKAVQDQVFVDIMNSDTEKLVAGLGIPTLIVWGDRDQLVDPEGAAILHRLLPNSSVIIMSGIGHVPMMESPAQVAADFLSFQQTLSGGTRPQ